MSYSPSNLHQDELYLAVLECMVRDFCRENPENTTARTVLLLLNNRKPVE